MKGPAKIAIFIFLAFAASWLLAEVFYLAGGQWSSPAAVALGVAYMFGPLLAAILVQRVFCRQPVFVPLGVSFKVNIWFLVAWMLPLVVALGALGISLLLPGVTFSPEMEGLYERFESVLTPEQIREMEAQSARLPLHPFWIALLQGLIAGVTINTVAGFGEELGWRGFLQRELSHLGFYRSSLAIGGVWGIWHAPIILLGHNYPSNPVSGVFMMILWCVLLTPLFSYVRLKSGSVVAASVLHGSLNGTAGLALMVVKGPELLVGVTGLAGFIALLIANAAIFVYDRFIAREPIIGRA